MLVNRMKYISKKKMFVYGFILILLLCIGMGWGSTILAFLMFMPQYIVFIIYGIIYLVLG